MGPYRVAVTGVGGGSGQAVLKTLLNSPLMLDITAIDVTPLSEGLYWTGMNSVVLPKPEEDITAWERFVIENRIELLIPGSDRDLPPLAAVADAWKQHRICRVAVSSTEMVTLADDKAFTTQALYEMGLRSAASHYGGYSGIITDWMKLHPPPLVVKPRHGAASRGMHICQDKDEVMFYWQRTPDPIVQEYLEGDEYTCAIFFDVQHQPVAKFALRRWLRGGDTYRAEVCKEGHILTFLDTLGQRLSRYKPFGPINVQLRDTPLLGPTVFEFNARCSGTTAIRAHFGYNEPEMLVRHICKMEAVTQPPTTTGFVFRHWEDFFLDGVAEQDMERANE